MNRELHEFDAQERRIIIVASPEKKVEIENQVRWFSVLLEPFLPLQASDALLESPWTEKLLPTVGAQLGRGALWLLRNRRVQVKYPFIDPVTARAQFQFPVSHPVDGFVYACSETAPLLYVPLDRFHSYMYEAKLSDFIKLCSSLGAKRVSVVYAEEEGRNVTTDFRPPPFQTVVGPVSGEVRSEYTSRHSEDGSLVFEYAQPDHPPTAHASPWMIGEPTWMQLQEGRLNGGLERGFAEFKYLDEMGINVKLAVRLQKLNLKLGGEFQKIRKLRLRWEVEFWPRSQSRI